MQHVRDHLVAMMEALADPEVTPELIERAKATSALAQTFTNTVKVEIDAMRASGMNITDLPEVLKPAALPAPPRGVIEGKRS